MKRKIEKFIVRISGKKEGKKISEFRRKWVNVLGFFSKCPGLNKQTNKKIVQNLCIFSNENFNVKTKSGTKKRRKVLRINGLGFFLPIFSKWTGLNCWICGNLKKKKRLSLGFRGKKAVKRLKWCCEIWKFRKNE